MASAAASSAYLTASEIFPLEMRALAIAVFYALGTLIGGASAPYAVRVSDRHRLRPGRSPAATRSAPLLMLIAAATEFRLGIDAEGKSLESIAEPLSG